MKFKGNETEYRKKQSSERRSKDPVRYLVNQARYRARKAGTPFTLEVNELEIPTHCPVFGIPLSFKSGGRHDGSYSLDRRDNSIGYTKENTRVISWRANQMKGDLTIAEVEALLKYMKGEL